MEAIKSLNAAEFGAQAKLFQSFRDAVVSVMEVLYCFPSFFLFSSVDCVVLTRRLQIN
jgi:hypothetical protein